MDHEFHNLPSTHGDCQTDGPFLGPYYDTGPNLGDPKKDHNFDNPPHDWARVPSAVALSLIRAPGPCTLSSEP